MIKEFFRISAKNIRRRKLRSWLTIIGIIISIATIFILISVSLGLNAAVKEQFRQLGTDKFFIHPKGSSAPGAGTSVILSNEDVDAIKKIGGVKSVTYNAFGNVKIEYANQFRFNYVMGVPLDTLDVFAETGFINPDEGRLLSEGDSGKIMVGSQYKYNSVFKNPVNAGDTLKLNNLTFRVKTVLKAVGNPQDDKNIYVPLDDFYTLFPERKDHYDQIVVQIEPGQNLTELAEKVSKQLLRSRGLTEKTRDFTILTPEELLATFGTILNILTGFLLGVAAISLLVGSIGIANTMFTSVIERTKEIGVMKAVGARNSDIVKIFTIESGLIGLIGGIGGIIIGFIFGAALEFVASHQFGTTLLQVSTPWYLFVGSLLFSFCIGAVSGIIPAFRASHIRPVEALRYE
jgi:putative ABC transport system permease protein